VLLAAALVHIAAVWAVPWFVMWRLASNATPEMRAPGAVYLPPMTDHTQRRVVLPSPDLLYATCSFDLRQRPMRIRAAPVAPHYWSIALYAANADNFLVVNDRQVAGAPVDLWLVGPAQDGGQPPPGARVITAPTSRGMLLMRVLVADAAADLPAAETARRTLRCDPA
jgi:uncharacterized membrane protein